MKPIVVQELHKSFKSKGKAIKALDAVSFFVESGQSVGFIGQNGAGKSTSIKILFGALRADAGQALLMGRAADDPLSRQGVGYVPENPYLYDQLTPREVLSSGLRLHGIKGQENHLRTERWLERMGIAYAADKRIRNLSKGMTQRTALAHAFAIEPQLLVLDEPMSGLDPIGRRQVADLMQEYRQGGGTLFFSTHILHDVERLADRFLMIHKGRIRAQQSIAEMLTNQSTLVVRYYGAEAMSGFVQDAGMIWKGSCERAEMPATLAAIAEAGGTLLNAHPRNSLEELFDSIVSETV
ncbi:ABC transporter ATP-binding protein [Pseudomonas stutzeri]|uniref:ABC transporter ATP-binding protein n=1 Tax=Stutzerimonas stutzeri TaxID=316 RepID=A0A2N8SQB3_STUST|nr:ABC transporter ATP-binding protein [Stutzerimonas stutzeri]MCQ4250244.1 ABC transporter ATP-binding protein [Stutzerimonas stutzeri]PNG04677.1 ABC transporter ATP-binding protein [Stutzerimonas stutzeri]